MLAYGPAPIRAAVTPRLQVATRFAGGTVAGISGAPSRCCLGPAPQRRLPRRSGCVALKNRICERHHFI